MFKVYVDGQHGTTGLLVNERLENHPDVFILKIPYEERHNKDLRIQLLNTADIVFLCLPDKAAKEALSLVTNPDTKIIDASTAHRVNDDWTYGFPELSEQHRKAVEKARRLSNPGCHATAAISILYPLVKEGIIDQDLQLSIMSITGYSGGGKKMIETYKHTDSIAYKAPRQYALSMSHKHIPEMMKQSGLRRKPLFMPVVSNYERGLAATIPLAIKDMNKYVSIEALTDFYKAFYKKSRYIRVLDASSIESLVDNAINIQSNNDSNFLDIHVYGNDDQVQIIAKLDNLGKGASGAAIQNMNIMLGIDESRGL